MKERTLFLTGASSGLGEATLRAFLADGFRILTPIRGGATRFEKLYPDLKPFLTQDKCRCLDVDLLDLNALDTLIPPAIQEFGGSIDLLINNAGFGVLGPLELQSSKQIEEQIRVNYLAPIRLIQLLLPSLRRTRGKILNLSSIAGRLTFPYYGSYSASKFALEAAIEALHYELKPFQVQVCLVEPGGFRTEFNRKVLHEIDHYSRHAEIENYRKPLLGFRNWIRDKSETYGADPVKVADLLLNLSKRKRLPLRKLIGHDALLLGGFRSFLPEKAFRSLIAWAFNHSAFRGSQ